MDGELQVGLVKNTDILASGPSSQGLFGVYYIKSSSVNAFSLRGQLSIIQVFDSEIKVRT